ncbi:MAG: carboxypeptidase regulatory-like domain-containing protein [Bacillota bacterium]
MFTQNKKTLSIILLITFLFTQLAFAANNEIPMTNTSVPATNIGVPTANTSVQDATSAGNNLMNYYISQWLTGGPAWLKRIQISGNFADSQAVWQASTIQPLTNYDDNLNNVLFWQASYASLNNTANIGLGYRDLSESHKSIYGLNMFYDRQFTVAALDGSNAGSHQRVGLGLEWFYGPLEARANAYYGLGDDVFLGNSGDYAYWERVMNGYDASLSTNLSFMSAPWLKLGVVGSNYMATQSYQGVANPDVSNIAAVANLQIFPQLSINAAYNMQNTGTNNASFGFAFNLLAPPVPALFCGNEIINDNASNDISYKMLQQVQRNNTIQTERYTLSRVSDVNITVLAGNSPISDATVTVFDNNNVQVAQSSSGINGVYSFEHLYNGNYKATVVKSTYDNASATFAINGINTALTINLVSTKIAIEAVWANDTAMNNQNVTLTGNGTIINATTNSNGIANFYGLAPGTYTPTLTTTINDTIYSSLPRTITIAKGQLGTAKIIGPQQPGSGNANITLTDNQGNPISGTTVQVYSGPETTQTATTNTSGVAAFTNLPLGTYTFSAVNSGMVRYSNNVSVTNNTTATGAISFSTNSFGNINLIITAKDGTPINSVNATLVTLSGQQTNYSATSATTGIAAYTNIPTDSYVAVATYENNQYSSPAFSVAPGTAATPNITVGATAPLYVVVNDNNIAQPGLVVNLQPGNIQGVTDTNGNAYFSDAPVGVINTSVYTQVITQKTTTVSFGKSNICTFNLNTKAQAEITVLDISGTPIANSTVQMTGLNNVLSTTDTEGVATFTDLTPTTQQQLYAVINGSVVSGQLALAAGTVKQYVLKAGSGNLQAQVIDASGVGIAGALVNAVNFNNSATINETTDSAGNVNLPLASGLWTVTAVYGGNAYAYSANGDSNVEILANSVKYIQITADAISPSVKVIDNAGATVYGALVYYNNEKKMVTTNMSGIAQLTGATNGTQQILVYPNGRGQSYHYTYNINLQNGVTQILQNKTGTMRVHVIDGNGNPFVAKAVQLINPNDGNEVGQADYTNSAGYVDFIVPIGNIYTASSGNGISYFRPTENPVITNNTITDTYVKVSTLPTANVTVTLDGTPIANASVTAILNSIQTQMVNTNSNGVAIFTNLQPGNYDFQTIFLYNNNTYNASVQASLVNGTYEVALNYSTTITGTATVLLLDANNVPVVGGTVYSDVNYGTTNSSGYATLTNLQVGNATIFCGANSITTNIVANQTTNVTLKKAIGTINVTVYDANGNVAPNISIQLTNANMYITTIITNAIGVATFTNLPIGTNYNFMIGGAWPTLWGVTAYDGQTVNVDMHAIG